MALIDGGKVSEAGWLKVITALLGLVVILGGIVWGRIEATLNTVIEIQIMQGRHSVEISEIKRRIDALELVRGGKTMLLPSDLGNPQFRFRGRGPGSPKNDVPRPPSQPPKDQGIAPKPEPRQELPAMPESNKRDKLLPVDE